MLTTGTHNLEVWEPSGLGRKHITDPLIHRHQQLPPRLQSPLSRSCLHLRRAHMTARLPMQLGELPWCLATSRVVAGASIPTAAVVAGAAGLTTLG
jgi:hypothetical protein